MQRHITTITIIMIDGIRTQLTLQTWMSAAFPTGAFSCSHGMETAISDGRIADAASCEDWISGIMQYGSGWNDAVLMVNAYSVISEWDGFDAKRSKVHPQWQSLKAKLTITNQLALALTTGAERLRETTMLGQAFAKAVGTNAERICVTSLLDEDVCLPVSIGASGALAAIPAEQLIPAALQASSSNLVWIATRLIPLGQTQALQMITRLQLQMANLGIAALSSTLDDVGSCALLADLASIEHEQLPSRICIT